MNQIRVLIVLSSFFFFNVKAQDQSNHSNTHTHKTLHPSLAVVIGILAVMFSLTFLIVAYARFCNIVVIDHLTNDQAGGLVQSRSSSSGIDKKLIESLPFFRFSSLKGSKEGLECVVCLSKFEDEEVLRLLPKCKHAFHLTCIDKWLESHSSCPLCRYKFNVSELTNFTFTNSLRYNENPLGLNEGPNFEVFVQREQDRSHRSPRYNLGSSFRKFGKFKKEELLIQENEKEFLHKFKHKIIVSDIVCKSRWSDVNSSDFMALNSEMINAMLSKRFSPLSRHTERFNLGFSPEEHIVKINEDMGRKRFFESRVGSREGLECSVCLSKFEDSDVLRLLPICMHAFHMKCIDMWLKAHVSCPLCRYKFHVDELSNFGSTASIRYPQDLSNLSNNLNCHELFVQREEKSPQGSLRVDSECVEPLVPSSGKNFDQENTQNFNHKIIVNDIIDRSRWSDVKSSDLLFLNSQMISVASSSALMNENVARNNGSGRISRSNSLASSTTSNNLRSLNVKMKRSMSDIANISRFKEYIVNNKRNEESLLNGNGGKEERMKKLWFSMSRKTVVQLFGGQEKISKELEGKRYSSNV
ncbi:hypothetical protein LguiA_036361 [Lonicera macranthoides]